MHYRRMGQWGLKLSEISLGTWITFGEQIEEQTAIDLVHAAYEQGVNYFDTADINAGGKAEKILGKAIANLPRESIVLSSKVFGPTMPGPNGRGLSRKHVFESVHGSLNRLGTDYLDIYFCQRYDPDTPYEELVYTMHTLIQQGKILYWGTSEWRAAQIATAYGIARQYNLMPPVVEQSQYNMFTRRRVEQELASLYNDRGLGLIAWGPLFSGVLSGKYNDSIPDGSRASMDRMGWMHNRLSPDKIGRVRQLTALARELGLTTAQLAIAWLLRRKEVSTVITGATSVEQLEENLEAEKAKALMTDEVLEEIELILDNLPDE